MVGITCASGEVIFGAVGDEERLEFTVIGDAVNTSAKLEKHTKVLKTRAITTRETYDLAMKQGYIKKDIHSIQYLRHLDGGGCLVNPS